MEEGRSQPFTAGPGPSAPPVTAAVPSQSAAPPPPAAPGAQPEAIPSYFLNNPAMLLAAQQMAAQKLLQQQLQIKANGQALSAGLALQPSPASVPAEAPLPVSNGAHTSAALERRRTPEEPTEKPLERVDPGGRIVWAKLGAYPWWPAKVLTRGRDLSFPPLEEPPRPNAIPVRFFGTYDFSWLGSKRAVMDWAEGKEQCMAECDQESFLESVAEVDHYFKTGMLPDEFYTTPQHKPGRKKSGVGGKARKSDGKHSDSLADGGVQTPGQTPEERRKAVLARRRQYLQRKGLIPPDNSPYRDGKVAVNPAVLALQAAWAAGHPSLPPAMYMPLAMQGTSLKPQQ